MKAQVVIDWVNANGVSAAAWQYAKDDHGRSVYSRGPLGMVLYPLNGLTTRNLFIPLRTWVFVKHRLVFTHPREPSMFAVR